ncbi:hypothetical protein PWT90_09240 [Aphanocladium album]|nr:hypothetical protein PWT90_09240 [Aphanocladium album]
MSKQVWLITGVSNGFSLLPALKALAAGHSVIGTVRSKTKSADAVRQITDAGGHVIELEMTDSQNNIIAAIHDAEKTYGQVEVLVNNAGYTILGALEQFSEEEVNLQYQTNVFGPLFVTQAVLPGMRARRRGTILGVFRANFFHARQEEPPRAAPGRRLQGRRGRPDEWATFRR